MRLPRGVGQRVLTLLAATALVAPVGCSKHDSGPDRRVIEQTVRRAIEAENTGDVATFLALWTDDGLRRYDAGSRNDIESGKVQLGAEQTDVRRFQSITVKGDRAEAVIDSRVEIGLYRSQFALARSRGVWRMDGFKFLGPAPPPERAAVVPVTAVEYGYNVDAAALARGDAALKFVNQGTEQHEISVLSIPDRVTMAEAVLALTAFRGQDAPTLPEGYSFRGHLAYEPPGSEGTYTLADKLPPGRYAFACFLPVGGLTDLGTPKVANAESHVARGMLAAFTVA